MTLIQGVILNLSAVMAFNISIQASRISDASHGYAHQVTYDEVHLMFAIKFFPPENKRD